MEQPGILAGPVLHLRGASSERLKLVAVAAIAPAAVVPPVMVGAESIPPELLVATRQGQLWAWEFQLPGQGGSYMFAGQEYRVRGDWDGDLDIAFVACNGQEHDDFGRNPEQRNALWLRMAGQEPLHLLFHGGDQIYADEVVEAHPLAREWVDGINQQDLTQEQAQTLRDALRDAYFARYVQSLSGPGVSAIMAQTPSLAIWDDHDIVDGWGSLPVERLDAPVGRMIFTVAREMYLAFQCGARAEALPPLFLDNDGSSLSFAVDLPSLSIIAPDLRSTRRPYQVMSEQAWQSFEATLQQTKADMVFCISSVPALGPRLSLVERLMKLTKRMERYEDDLRDQWQSYKHRKEWQRFLGQVMAVHDRNGQKACFLSGEIHLATRGEMSTSSGSLHQLVASGIAHDPPPNRWALLLGLLAGLGEAPLKGHPIRIRPLPGQSQRYIAQRNYLTLHRRANKWHAHWYLEEAGQTPPLKID